MKEFEIATETNSSRCRRFESDSFEFESDQEFEGQADTEIETPLDEVEEMELAAELLAVSSEEELDQFLGKLFKGARGEGIKKVARPLGGILKGIAKKALPFVGGALGSFIPIPGVGTAVGTALGGAASKLLEVDLEGMSPEDQEFELARVSCAWPAAPPTEAGECAGGASIQTPRPLAAVRNAASQLSGQQVADGAKATERTLAAPGQQNNPARSLKMVATAPASIFLAREARARSFSGWRACGPLRSRFPQCSRRLSRPRRRRRSRRTWRGAGVACVSDGARLSALAARSAGAGRHAG